MSSSVSLWETAVVASLFYEYWLSFEDPVLSSQGVSLSAWFLSPQLGANLL